MRSSPRELTRNWWRIQTRADGCAPPQVSERAVDSPGCQARPRLAFSTGRGRCHSKWGQAPSRILRRSGQEGRLSPGFLRRFESLPLRRASRCRLVRLRARSPVFSGVSCVSNPPDSASFRCHLALGQNRHEVGREEPANSLAPGHWLGPVVFATRRPMDLAK
jgi:hypothetical protein